MVALTEQFIPVLSDAYNKYREVRKTNIMIAIVIFDLLKSMFGPRGASKMLVTETGDVVITSEGKTLLSKLRVSHPIAKLLISVSETQNSIVGDGTKTAVMLAAELLKEAWKLLDQKVHPTIIIRGYSKALKKALEVLDSIAMYVSFENEEVLKNVARTVICSRIGGLGQNHLVDLVIRAVKHVVEKRGNEIDVDVEYVDFVKRAGGNINDSELVEGVVIFREKPHQKMPGRIENAKIALLGCSLDPLVRKNIGLVKEYEISRPEQMKEFIDAKREIGKRIVELVKCTGARVVFCRKRISESILDCFTEEGILALELVGEKDMVRLGKATGGRIVSSVYDLRENDLGEAGLVEFRKIASDEMLFIERCREPKAVTMLIRGGTEQVIEEVERTIKSSLKVLEVTIKSGRVIVGGGATEIEIARKLRDLSRTFEDREQLAIEAFASAMEVIPKTLATNSGLNPIDALTKLRAEHVNGCINVGINAMESKVDDVAKMGVIESFKVKQHALISASETAKMILKIDDFIAAINQKELREEEKRKERERKRIMNEKVRRVLEKEEELKEVEKHFMEKISHPETI